MRGNDLAIADRATLVRNDETTLVPQYLSALVPFKKVAFTLAEVLITLGIIGVVAAVTMPVLIQKHQEKVTVTKVKKAYSVLSQALLLAVNEYGAPENWGTYTYTPDKFDTQEVDAESVTRIAVTNLVNQIKNVKVCGFKSEGCFASGYKSPNGRDERDFEKLNNRYYKFITADGFAIAIEGYLPTSTMGGEIWVDINGSARPNVVGKDLFLFQFDKYKVIPFSYPCECGNIGWGYGTAAYILANGNMDYLHCK